MMNESANNLSKEQQFYIKKTRHHKHLVLFFQIFIFVFFIILWEISSHNGIINAFIFSSPSQMLLACQELFLTGDLLKHIGITLAETFGSFFLVASISLLIAILLWWNTTLSEIFEPYFVILNSLPKSAMAPIFIVWLGNNMKTIIIAGNIKGKTRTLPLAVYSAVASGNMKEAGECVAVLVCISFIVVICMNYFSMEKKG